MEVYLQLLPEEKAALDNIESILTQTYNAVVSHIKTNKLYLSESEINKFLTKYRHEKNLQIGSRVLRLVTAIVSKRGLFTYKNIPADWKPTDHFPIVIRYRNDDGIMRNYKLGQDNYGINVQTISLRHGLFEIKFAKEKQPVPIRLLTPAVFGRSDILSYDFDRRYGLILSFDYLLKLLFFQAYNFILFKDKAGNWKISIPIHSKRVQQLITHQIEFHLGYLGSIPFRKHYHDYYSYNDTTDFNTRIFKFVRKYAKEIAFARVMTTVQATMRLVGKVRMGVVSDYPKMKADHFVPRQIYIPENSAKYYNFDEIKKETVLYNITIKPTQWFKDKGVFPIIIKMLSLFQRAPYQVFNKAIKHDKDDNPIITPDLLNYFKILPKIPYSEYQVLAGTTTIKRYAMGLKFYRNESHYADTLVPVIISLNYKDYFLEINLDSYNLDTLQPIADQSKVFNTDMYKRFLKQSIKELSQIHLLSHLFPRKIESKLRRKTYMTGRVLGDEMEAKDTTMYPLMNIAEHIKVLYNQNPIHIPFMEREEFENKHYKELENLMVNSIYLNDRNNELNKFWFKHKFYKQFTYMVSMGYIEDTRNHSIYMHNIFNNYITAIYKPEDKKFENPEYIIVNEIPVVEKKQLIEKYSLRELSPSLNTEVISNRFTSVKAQYQILRVYPLYLKKVTELDIIDDREARLKLAQEIRLDLNELARNSIKLGVWDLYNSSQRKLYYNSKWPDSIDLRLLGFPKMVNKKGFMLDTKAVESIIKFEIKDRKPKSFNEAKSIVDQFIRDYFIFTTEDIANEEHRKPATTTVKKRVITLDPETLEPKSVDIIEETVDLPTFSGRGNMEPTEEELMVKDNVLLWLGDTLNA